MTFEPINIDIKDLRRFTEVAYIIDSPLFIKEAKRIRKKYKITYPLRKNNLQQWTLANVPEKEIKNLFQEITDLRIFFSYDSNYQDVFEKAVLGGNVNEEDFGNTSLINFAKLPPFLSHLVSHNFAILLTPQTDKKDVFAAYKQYRSILKEFQSESGTHNPRDKRIDQRNEIERDRRWYWKKENGMKYREIAKEEGIKDEDFYPNYKSMLKEAILSYKKRLIGIRKTP